MSQIKKGDKLNLLRETEVISVPFGLTISLPEGESIEIMQAKGSTVSVGYQGRLYMVEGINLDALGMKSIKREVLAKGASNQQILDFAWAQLRTCFDPEIPVNIVELGLVYGMKVIDLIDGRKMLNIKMTLTAPGCGMGEVIAADARRKLLGAEDLSSVNTEIVFNPPWSRQMMSEDAQLELGMF